MSHHCTTQYCFSMRIIWGCRILCLIDVCLGVSPLQNEEVLKKCAQDYLARIKQEEQRYQTLKIHAEEKLDKWVGKEVTPSRQVSHDIQSTFMALRDAIIKKVSVSFSLSTSRSGPMRKSPRCVQRRARRKWRWVPAWGWSRARWNLWNKPCSRRSEGSSSHCILMLQDTLSNILITLCICVAL